MPEQIHASPDGAKYQLVGIKTTTPTSDVSAKAIPVDSKTVDVVFSDSRLQSIGSQFGYVAIDIDGTVYSRTHEEYMEIGRHTYV